MEAPNSQSFEFQDQDFVNESLLLSSTNDILFIDSLSQNSEISEIEEDDLIDAKLEAISLPDSEKIYPSEYSFNNQDAEYDSEPESKKNCFLNHKFLPQVTETHFTVSKEGESTILDKNISFIQYSYNYLGLILEKIENLGFMKKIWNMIQFHISIIYGLVQIIMKDLE